MAAEPKNDELLGRILEDALREARAPVDGIRMSKKAEEARTPSAKLSAHAERYRRMIEAYVSRHSGNA